MGTIISTPAVSLPLGSKDFQPKSGYQLEATERQANSSTRVTIFTASTSIVTSETLLAWVMLTYRARTTGGAGHGWALRLTINGTEEPGLAFGENYDWDQMAIQTRKSLTAGTHTFNAVIYRLGTTGLAISNDHIIHVLFYLA